MASVVSRFIKNHKLLSLIACAGILMGGNAMLRHYTGYEYESPFAKAARQAQERVEVRSDQSGLNIAQAQQNRIENSAASAFEQVLEQGRLAASGYGTNTSGIEVPVSNEVPSTINDKITAAGIGTPGQSSTENTPAPQNPQSFEEVMALARQNRANGTTGIQVQTQVAEQSSSTVEQTPTVQQESNVETPSSAPSEVAPQNPEQQRLTKSEQKEALKAIADIAIKRHTGARGLRSVVEGLLLNTMYDIPSVNDVAKIIVDEQTVKEQLEPKVIKKALPANEAAC